MNKKNQKEESENTNLTSFDNFFTSSGQKGRGILLK